MPFWIQMPYGSDRPTPARRSENFEIHGKDDYWPPYLAGYPLTPELRSRLPKVMPIEGPKRRPMPDIFNLGFGGSPNDFIVNERVKDLIESLEPDVHTFTPVELLEEKRNQKYSGYYYLYVGQAIDAIVVDKSDFQGGFGAEGYANGPRLRLLGRNKVLDAKKIAGKHLWRGGKEKLGGGGDPNGGVLFCSDQLARIFKSNKVDGWVFDTPCSLI
jgi:hypothetical protein